MVYEHHSGGLYSLLAEWVPLDTAILDRGVGRPNLRT